VLVQFKARGKFGFTAKTLSGFVKKFSHKMPL